MTHPDENAYPTMGSIEYTEHLDQCHDQVSWLKALFLVIQTDPDVQPGLHLHHLAKIGEHLSENALSYINSLRSNTVKDG